MKFNDFHCPNCGKALIFNKKDSRHECPECHKKYQFDIYFFRTSLWLLIAFTLPLSFIRDYVKQAAYFQHKNLAYLLLAILYILILYFSGAIRFMQEKLKLIKWHEIKENQDNEELKVE